MIVIAASQLFSYLQSEYPDGPYFGDFSFQPSSDHPSIWEDGFVREKDFASSPPPLLWHLIRTPDSAQDYVGRPRLGSIFLIHDPGRHIQHYYTPSWGSHGRPSGNSSGKGERERERARERGGGNTDLTVEESFLGWGLRLKQGTVMKVGIGLSHCCVRPPALPQSILRYM